MDLISESDGFVEVYLNDKNQKKKLKLYIIRKILTWMKL